MKSRKQFLAGILVSGLLILGGCGGGKHEVNAATSTPVQTAAIEQVTVDTSTQYSASVEPDTSVDMAFKVDGYVDSLLKVGGRNLQEGDHVAKGAVLARVRQSDYRAGLDAAQAQAMTADEGLKVATWQLSQVEAIHKKARLDAERATALYQEKALTKPDYDAATAQLDSTRAQVEAARKNVEAQRSMLSSARAQERSSTITFEDTALVAPMGAVILEKRVEPGTLVARGTAAFRVGDLSTVRMAFGVPDTVVSGLKLGAMLAVQVDAFPDSSFQGRIREIAAAADTSTRLYRVEVAIPNKAQHLKAGMMGKVSVPGSQPAVLLPAVPASALLRSASDPNGAAVFVVEGGSKEPLARLRTIRLGQFIGSRTTVLAGLKEGERVVTGGRQNLVDRAPIRVVD
ncbi:MAG: efflux RND transporter periplasmic adaptor subunit [Bryobacteraceae bacterium]|nr:efflux RND transporter periplasmic adaptor subunit [Bryobacteraceae bacterium]